MNYLLDDVMQTDVLQPVRPSETADAAEAYLGVSGSNQIARDQQVMEVEAMITSFTHLLTEHPRAPQVAGLHFEIAALERWLDKVHDGRISRMMLTERGMAWLEKHRVILKYATDESLRSTAAGVGPKTLANVIKTQTLRDDNALVDTPAPEEIGVAANLQPSYS